MLLTRSPLSENPKTLFTFDLHVLSTPPAFILSQDQTLHKEFDSVDFPNHQPSHQIPGSPDQQPSRSPIIQTEPSVLSERLGFEIRLSYHSSVVNVLTAAGRWIAIYRLLSLDRLCLVRSACYPGGRPDKLLPAFRRGKCVVYITRSPLSNRSPRICVILLRRI